jgi:hypothetical protein
MGGSDRQSRPALQRQTSARSGQSPLLDLHPAPYAGALDGPFLLGQVPGARPSRAHRKWRFIMNVVEIVAVSLAVGITVGAVAWEWLRGDLMPRLWNERNETRLRELTDRLSRLEGRLAAA